MSAGSEPAVDRRVYPSLIPEHPAHPTTADFEIIESGDSRGRGLIAKRAFAAGERIARLSGVLVAEPGLNTIQILPTLHMHDEWFCRYLLHSCAPNMAIDLATLDGIAEREIAPGDWLSIDYGRTEDRLGRQFACGCGAPSCRGWILGRKEVPTEEGRKILALRGSR